MNDLKRRFINIFLQVYSFFFIMHRFLISLGGVFGFLLIFSVLACRKTLSTQSVVEQNVSKFQENALDSCIHKEFTNPYGIEVVYRWNRNYTNDKYNFPPMLDKAKQVLETIKELWIGTYNLLGGKDFMKGKNPIRIRLYGGPNLKSIDENSDDVVELVDGSTSSPIEMSIYNVNDFDISSEDQVFGLMQSVQHQFAKRLLDLVPYDKSTFMKISGDKYFADLRRIADYFDITNANRNKTKPQNHHNNETNPNGRNGRKYLFGLNDVINKEGFFTVQARLSPENDVAETIAIMLTYANTDVADAIRKARTNQDAIPKDLITKKAVKPKEENEKKCKKCKKKECCEEEEEEEEEEKEEDTDSEGDEALAEARQKDYKSEKEARYAYDMLSKKRKFVVNYMDKAFGIPLLRMQLISADRTKKWLEKHKKSN